jgi:RNA polymerase sigma-70 factor (ECF subfamily)
MKRDLVERARKGDHDAFAELAGAAISRLDATAWLMLRDSDRATDAVQVALVRAWRSLPTLRDPDRFDAWLQRLLVNACIDEIRHGRHHRRNVDVADMSNPPAVADAASAIADRDQLERGFSRLEPEERAVIVLHHYLDLSLPEVAATLRIPLGTAKSRLYRGLKEMRAALDADARPGPNDIREGRTA